MENKDNLNYFIFLGSSFYFHPDLDPGFGFNKINPDRTQRQIKLFLQNFLIFYGLKHLFDTISFAHWPREQNIFDPEDSNPLIFFASKFYIFRRVRVDFMSHSNATLAKDKLDLSKVGEHTINIYFIR